MALTKWHIKCEIALSTRNGKREVRLIGTLEQNKKFTY
jgi:hypothetical protein